MRAGRVFYIEVTDLSDRLTDIPNFRSWHLPSEADPNDDEWRSDPILAQQADDALNSWLKSKIFQPDEAYEQIRRNWRNRFHALVEMRDPELR